MDTFYLVLADALLINTSLEGDDAISDFLLSDKCKKIVKIIDLWKQRSVCILPQI